jgi:serine/threonine-protein kinase
MAAPGVDPGATRQGLPRGPAYSFGPFLLDVAERLLLRDRQPVALTPKAFDLLVQLIRRPGQLVEKRELMAALWPDTVVEETNLTYTMSALRKALGDGPDPEQIIQTVPTRGYRFVAPVQDVAALAVATPPAPRRAANIGLALALIGVGAAAGGFAVWRAAKSGSAPARVVRFELPVGVGARDASIPAVSPDGRRIVYSARVGDRRQLFVRALDSVQATPIPDTFGAKQPFFSPDGRSVAACGRGMFKLDLATGQRTNLGVDDCDLRGATWASDGNIYFTRTLPLGLAVVPAVGGAVRSLTTLAAGEIAHGWPHLLPDGRHLLLGVVRSGGNLDDADIQVLSLATGERRTVVRGGTAATFLPTGHLLYAQGGGLLAVGFDPERLAVRGTPARVLEGVAQAPLSAYSSPTALFTVSTSGTLAYHPGGSLVERTTLDWQDTAGPAEERIAAPPGLYVDPSLSADGRWLALAPSYGEAQDLWVHDLERRTWTRLTSDFGWECAPVWHPRDRTRLVFTTGRGSEDLVSIRADGSGEPELLHRSPHGKYAASSSTVAGLVAFSEAQPGNGFDLWLLDLNGKPAARPFLQTRFDEASPALSPDGRWLAYDSNESGSFEVYARPVSGEGKWHVSPGGGSRPRWSSDGSTIFYRRLRREAEAPGPDRMMAVRVSTVPSFAAEKPHVVAEGRFSHGGSATPNYDVTADGRRLLLVKPATESLLLSLIVVENWFTELQQKIGE